MRARFAALAVCLISSSLSQAQEILNFGDPVPPLVVSSWVKGEKVEPLEAGKIYVVEFWATWCGPCRASVPHLTELAHKYKEQGVRVIGISVWEQDTSKVRPFVQEMGDQMDYSVALDSIPAGGTGDDGVMAKTWMAAAGEYGIPTSFVIQDRTIAWIGHPLQLEEPLRKILAGTWNPKDHAAERLVAKTKERKVVAAREKIFRPYLEKDYKATLALIEEVIAGAPELAEPLATLKFAVLNYLDDVETTLSFGTKLVETNQDEPQVLNNMAWAIVKPDRKSPPDNRLAQLALQAAKRADELTKGEDFNLLDTLACALYRTGAFAAAITTEEKALDRLIQSDEDRSHPYVEEFKKRIELFRAALNGQAARP